MPSSMFSLVGKAAVVTGGGRGIGRGIALAFADAAVLARTQASIFAVSSSMTLDFPVRPYKFPHSG